MRFDIITIFPELVEPYFQESLLKRAQARGLIEVGIHDLREWTTDSHNTVDDSPFGGGLGMVLKVGPVYQAVSDVTKKIVSGSRKIILFTPRGKKFSQRKATELSKLDQIIFICGRYEGVDERVGKYIADEEISIGNYDLMGGELPALVVTETVTRLIPGVIGKSSFLKEHVHEDGFIEYPQYTRPEAITIDGKERKVPPVLLSGDHKKIEEWRSKRAKFIR